MEDMTRYERDLARIEQELNEKEERQLSWTGFIDASLKTAKVLNIATRSFRVPHLYEAIRILELQAYREAFGAKDKINHEIGHAKMAVWHDSKWISLEQYTAICKGDLREDYVELYLKELRRNCYGK